MQKIATAARFLGAFDTAYRIAGLDSRVGRTARRIACSLLLLAGSALCAGLAGAQTPVAAMIATDARWTLAGSPYLLSGDVVVQNGATLTVDPGVTVYMGASSSLTVQGGAIKALGTAASTIQVLSDKTRLGQTAAPGDWKQWTFNAGTVNTRLEHVTFQHGRGLAVYGSAPTFNFLDLRNHQGAAITIDLAASPTGVGNGASGNTVNGIAVPAGDIAGSVRWGLRGLPYVVTAGTLSVGSSPGIQGVTPNTVEQGQTITLTVTGARLSGVANPFFEQAGLVLTPFTGGSSTQTFIQLQVDATAPVGPATLHLQVDAGELVLANAITVTQPLPAITGIVPTVVLAGTGASAIVVTGHNFGASSEVLFNLGSVPTQFISATKLRATLPNQTAIGSLQTQVRSPDRLRTGQYLLSNQVSLAVQAPVPPTLSIEPAPVALPPDSKPHDVTVRLSKADYRDNTLTISISDTSKATATPASLVIPAGQTTAKITITPKLAGTVSLVVASPTLATVTVPLFITADFRGANTSYAPAVGVVVLATPGSETRQVTVTNAVVGVSLGAVLTGVSPAAWTVGSVQSITVNGAAIPSGAQVSLVPGTGVTLGAVTVAPDGSQLQVSITAAAGATTGMRKVIVRDAGGKDIVFANPARSAVQLMTGLPTIDSIEPVVAPRGTLLTLLVRGRNLQQGVLRILPDTGVRVDNSPQIAADGTTLVASIDIAADAAIGDRVVQIVTPAGASAATALAVNTLSIVSSVRPPVTPIASPLVGVVVGTALTPDTVAVQQVATVVGLLVGSGVTEVVPAVGVIGTDVQVAVRGVALQGAGVSLAPSAGVSVMGSPSINAAGTELLFTLRVDAGAVLGQRRIVLSVGGKPLATVRPGVDAFLVSAPIPELTAVSPQILLIGQAPAMFTVVGRNLANVSSVRIEPPQGITVSGPYVANADGTGLTFNASAATGTVSGARTVIVTTAAGESSALQSGGNIVRVATQVGPTYAGLVTPAVGVVVGSASSTPQRFDGTLASRAVGIMVGTTAAPETLTVGIPTAAVGVIVGTAAQAMTPAGWLQGASGTITVTGRGLDAVTTATVLPSTGILLGTPASSAGGTVMTMSISVAPDAPQIVREVRLGAASNGRLSFVNPETARFGIGSLPTMDSISPIVFEQGKSATLAIRGRNLAGVTRVSFGPDGGIAPASAIIWTQDALGELLTVSVTVDATAALGNRVVRLEVPGGITSATAGPANTISVVTPQ